MVIVDASQTQPLDYRTPRSAQPRPIYLLEEDPEQRKWRYYRLYYRTLSILIIAILSLTIGRNFIVYHQWRPLSPADYVPAAQAKIAFVRAIKQYQSDTGSLPDDLQVLVPKYVPNVPWGFDMNRDHFVSHELRRFDRIEYDFAPASEGWSVKGGLTNGPIPLPPVTIH